MDAASSPYAACSVGTSFRFLERDITPGSADTSCPALALAAAVEGGGGGGGGRGGVGGRRDGRGEPGACAGNSPVTCDSAAAVYETRRKRARTLQRRLGGRPEQVEVVRALPAQRSRHRRGLQGRTRVMAKGVGRRSSVQWSGRKSGGKGGDRRCGAASAPWDSRRCARRRPRTARVARCNARHRP